MESGSFTPHKLCRGKGAHNHTSVHMTFSGRHETNIPLSALDRCGRRSRAARQCHRHAGTRLADPLGLVQTQAIESAEGGLRIRLNGSASQQTLCAPASASTPSYSRNWHNSTYSTTAMAMAMAMASTFNSSREPLRNASFSRLSSGAATVASARPTRRFAWQRSPAIAMTPKSLPDRCPIM
jgi:hypothetical protein